MVATLSHEGLESELAPLAAQIDVVEHRFLTAREKVRVANALGSLPEIDAALATGASSYSKVRAMTRIATPENEAKLLRMAHAVSAAQFVGSLATWASSTRLCRAALDDAESAGAHVTRPSIVNWSESVVAWRR